MRELSKQQLFRIAYGHTKLLAEKRCEDLTPLEFMYRFLSKIYYKTKVEPNLSVSFEDIIKWMNDEIDPKGEINKEMMKDIERIKKENIAGASETDKWVDEK
jgi:hypothetical protein